MAAAETISKIKTDLRIRHDALDGDISDMIDACLQDLRVCGVLQGESDPLILNAVKLYVRAGYTDDTNRAAAYMARYDAMKSCLMMAEGYGEQEYD